MLSDGVWEMFLGRCCVFLEGVNDLLGLGELFVTF